MTIDNPTQQCYLVCAIVLVVALAFVSPNMLAFHISALTLTMVILGGAGSVPGAVFGATLIIG